MNYTFEQYAAMFDKWSTRRYSNIAASNIDTFNMSAEFQDNVVLYKNEYCEFMSKLDVPNKFLWKTLSVPIFGSNCDERLSESERTALEGALIVSLNGFVSSHGYKLVDGSVSFHEQHHKDLDGCYTISFKVVVGHLSLHDMVYKYEPSAFFDQQNLSKFVSTGVV